MAKKLVSELSGADLDYWVAKSLGYRHIIDKYETADDMFVCYFVDWSPSTNPAQGWPIIERDKIKICPQINDNWYAFKGLLVTQNGMQGETSLIAAMRCRVASVYGETVGDDE